MHDELRTSRRSALKTVGVVGAAAMLGGCAVGVPVLTASEPPPQPTDSRKQIFGRVWATPFIDTHEHLCDEQDRLPPAGTALGADDWTVVLAGYLGSDLLTAGMPGDAHGKFYARACLRWRNGSCSNRIGPP